MFSVTAPSTWSSSPPTAPPGSPMSSPNETPDAIVCLDTFHVIGRAIQCARGGPPPRMERAPSGRASQSGQGVQGAAVPAAAQLGEPQYGTARSDLGARGSEPAPVPGVPTQEELRDIFALPLLKAGWALDDWLHHHHARPSRPRTRPALDHRRTTLGTISCPQQPDATMDADTQPPPSSSPRRR